MWHRGHQDHHLCKYGIQLVRLFQALVRFLTFNVCRQLLDMGGLLSVIHMEFVALNMDNFLDIVRLLSDDLLVITESVENRWTLLIKIGIRNLLKKL